MPEREEHNRLYAGKVKHRAPNRICQAQLFHIAFVFYNNAGATGKRFGPCFCNRIKAFNVSRHRFDIYIFANRFCKNGALAIFGIGEQNAAMVRFASLADIFNHFLERLLDIASAAQLDTGIEHIGRRFRRKICHGRRIRLGRHIITVNAVADIFAVRIQRQQEHVQPKAHHVEVNIGMERFARLNTAKTVVLEILVLRKAHLIRTTRHKRAPLRRFHFFAMSLVPCHNTDVTIGTIRIKLY